jgi:hypothetical protein
LKKWIKESNLSKKDAQEMLRNILLNYTPEEISEKVESDYSELPALVYIFLGNIQEAIKKKDINVTKELLEFAFGGEPQVNVTNNTLVDLKAVIMNQADSSPKERERIIGELEKITGFQE